MTKTAVQFGAGNIGRGFIGALISQAGYEVTFADVVKPVIEAINESRSYDIEFLDLERGTEKITNVKAVDSNSEDAVKAVASAEIVTTAVGPNVLKFVAPALAKGIQARKAAGAGPLNIIACENLVGNSTKLKELVLSNLKSEEDKKYLEENVGFPDCSVDRIVPPFKGDNILTVGVERFHEWIVEEPKLKGGRPDIPGMQFTDNLTAYVQRKLFTLNTGHAMTAYLGYLRDFETIDQAISDPKIKESVIKAMHESGAALCKKHGFCPKKHAEYIEKIEKRFENPHVHDETTRVGREPLRKLGQGDRLVGPVKMCKEFDLPHDNLLYAIAAALCYKNEDDPQSKELQEKIESKGIEQAIADLGFEKGSEDSKKILAEYKELQASA